METISRRRFFRTAATGLAAAGYLSRAAVDLCGNPLGFPIGCQTWPVRETIGQDFDGTLRRLAAEGFQAIEMCSPPGYKGVGFGPLVDIKPSDMRTRIQAAGLKCESCHFGFRELKEHLDDRLGWAKDLGLTQMIISTFALPKDASMKDWMQAADEANRIGDHTRKAGIQLGFHNHDFEFHKIDGQLIYDKLMGELEPQTVKMQFQVSVVQLGYHAADYFEKYPGRFISMHLQDWSPTKKKEVTLGKGIVDWRKLFTAARTGGVRNYFVEMDPEAMRESIPFLHNLTV